MTSHALESPAFGHPLNWLQERLTARRTEARNRRVLAKALELSDAALCDLGITRHEVESASRLPLSADAATELHRLSLERSRRR